MRVFWIGTTENINLPTGERDQEMIFLVRAVDEIAAKQRVIGRFPQGTTILNLEAWDVTDEQDDDA
jgi:hypothetical protein